MLKGYVLTFLIMATVILDYNTRNMQAQKALDYLYSLGIFKIAKTGIGFS